MLRLLSLFLICPSIALSESVSFEGLHEVKESLQYRLLDFEYAPSFYSQEGSDHYFATTQVSWLPLAYSVNPQFVIRSRLSFSILKREYLEFIAYGVDVFGSYYFKQIGVNDFSLPISYLLEAGFGFETWVGQRVPRVILGVQTDLLVDLVPFLSFWGGSVKLLSPPDGTSLQVYTVEFRFTLDDFFKGDAKEVSPAETATLKEPSGS